MSRTLVAGVTVIAALAAAGTASAGLVLGAHEAPGLKTKRATPAAGQKALAAALKPVRLPAPKGKAQASHFARKGVELWSLAYVLPNGKAAATQLRNLKRAAKGARRARIGDLGYTLAKKHAVVVFWRRRNAVGEVLLATRAAQRDNALAYAAIVDAHMDHVLGLTAWTRALDHIGPAGTVPRKTALDLFALAYGPLPGTKRPPGPVGRVDEGTMAGRSILQLWPRLTAAQQAAALKALGLTAIQLKGKKSSRLPSKVSKSTAFGDPGFTPLPGLTEITNKYAAVYGAKLSHTLKLKIVAGTTSTVVPDGALADAYPVDENGVYSNAATYCRIRLPSAGQAISNQQLLSLVLAHETFHCFQFSIMTPEGALSVNRRNWVLEGMADWAAISVVAPSFQVGGGNYLTYLSTPTKRLFERTYDAVGFFAHAEDATGDLWPRIPTILKQPTSEDNFMAIGGDSLQFLNSWGGSTFNDAAKLGFDWTMTLPLALPGYLSPDVKTITSSTGVVAQPYTYERYRINIDSNLVELYPLLHVQIQGHARLANHDLDTTDLEDRYFCLSGSCECPKGQEGTPPPAPPLGESVTDLALSANERATSGSVRVDSLDEYCKRKQKPPQRPPSGGGGGGGGCGGCGGSNGDPHLHTFDDRYYDFQGAGEYVLARSRVDRLELQARQEPFPGRNYLSINTAFAMRVAGDRVAVYRGNPLVARVNGRGFLVRAKPQRLPHGGSIRTIGNQVAVKWPDGTWARVIPVNPWGINILLKPAVARFGTFTGLLGNFNGTKADDWVSRGGRRITVRQYFSPAGFRLINRVLGESWRVKPRESLFDYARGQSTRTFTIRSFPHHNTTTAALLARQRRAALAACKRLHITNPQILEDCTLDVGATGDNRFATGSRAFEKTAGKFTVVHRRRTPPPPTGAETKWTPISKGGESNLVFGSLQHDGGKVVAAYLLRSGTAEAATFTPSVAADATGIRRDVITSGWSFLGHPFLLPRAGGGLQVLLSGTHRTTMVIR